jgi:hypothetical protein
MHHLINELRPHQARDNIRCILEMQKQQRIETAAKFKAHIMKIVDLLKICIQSIQNESTGKSSVYFDELIVLLKTANKLTKSLDKLNNGSVLTQTDFDRDGDDIEMKSVEEVSESGRSVSTSLKKLVEVSLNTGKTGTIVNKNCDFKDLVLCGLIDDYLTKENEF